MKTPSAAQRLTIAFGDCDLPADSPNTPTIAYDSHMASPTEQRLADLRVPFLDVAVDAYDFEESLRACCALIERAEPAHHVVINAGKCVLAHDDAALASSIRSAQVINADGQSVVWAASFLGHPLPERVAGIDLMEALLAECALRSWPVYFLGAREEVLDRAVETLRGRHPGLTVAGSHHGYYVEAGPVTQAIRESSARLLLIGISSPKKEQFVAENLDRLGPILAFGVGGSFDVVAGITSRAPRWMQRAGLEWLYRLMQEPRRMWRRYLVGNTRFLWLVLRARLGSR